MTDLPRIEVAIAGAQKSGTTSLLRYLAEHPQLSGQATTEIGYLVEDVEWDAGWEKAYARYFYAAATPMLLAKYAALYTDRKYIERLASHNPDCRILLVLRDPVERAFSAYRMERSASGLDRPFEDLLAVLDEQEDSSGWRRLFIGFGEYAPALRQIHDLFPKDQAKVLIYEDFVRDPSDACHQVFEFLGVDSSFEPRTTVVHNPHREPPSRAAATLIRWLRRQDNPVKRLAKQTLPPAVFDRIGGTIQGIGQRESPAEEMPVEVRERLGDYYRPLNLELAQMLGRDLSHWSGMAN